jgi:predicted DsbA family dithiol-disulfide isomerase
MQTTVTIQHYSDVLCVWAYIAQIRVTELEKNFPDDVKFEYHFLQVFGDVPGKIASQWTDRGGIDGYAAHVQEVAGAFEHINLHPRAWIANTPASSLPAHLALCGLRTFADAGQIEAALGALRQAFFVELADVSRQDVITDVLATAAIDTQQLQHVIDSGAAFAQLSADLVGAAQSGVRASPTMIFNEGRQMLAGNVGYRVLEANIRELLRGPAEQQSWC